MTATDPTDPPQIARAGGRFDAIRGKAIAVLRHAYKSILTRGGLVAACAAFLFLQNFGGSVINALDDGVSAARMRLIQSAPSGDLVVVSIDSTSLHAANTWPWPRERYARAIENLREAGADLIAFDIDFSAASTAHGDAALKAAVDAVPGTVILPTFAQSDSGLTNTANVAVGDTPIFGNANIEIQSDGQIRNYRRGYNQSGSFRPTIASVLADAPYGDTSSFKLDYGTRVNELEQISFEDVFQGRIDPARIAGRHVLIGSTALELGDTFATPVAPAMPGVLVHALAYENMVSGRMLLELTRPVTIGIGFVALLLLWPRRDQIDLPRFFFTHVAVVALFLLAPLIVQMWAPVSLNLFSVGLAQVLCVWAGVRRELNRRAAELVRQREAHLAHIAMHDSETGLPNRRAMLERVNELLAGTPREQVNVMVVGIDRFTTLRAAIGFARANEVVTQLCSQLREMIPDVEVFYISTSLIGMVFSPRENSAGADWIRSGIGELDAVSNEAGQEVEVRVRSGAAGSTLEGETAVRLVERATLALDTARAENHPHVAYDELASIDPRLQLAMVSGVDAALELGQFFLVYQTKVSASDGSVLGAEALLRWEHPELGKIAPSQFVPIAEETGAIDRLTLWVLDRVIADQAMARAQNTYAPVSLNLSARTLCNFRFCDLAIQRVLRANADICFEITETAVIASLEQARESIAAFRSAGIPVSIDDFGSGLSSLMYLKQIEADELKLDRELLSDISSSPRDQTIIRSTIELAHSLGMFVVAEGIENHVMRDLLASLGCDVLQGYHIARPTDISGFIAQAEGVQVIGRRAAQRADVA